MVAIQSNVNSKVNAHANQFDIVIIGGGAAGIGVAASLKRRDQHLTIAIIEPSDTHYYQPAWTLVGAGEFRPSATQKPMQSVIPRGVTWIKGAAERFDALNQTVETSNAEVIEYQQLIIATGLVCDWDAIEGLRETLGANNVTSNYRIDLAPYTWQIARSLKQGNAIFTQPPMPIKCAGAPQKAMYLSCSHWLNSGVLKHINVTFCNAGAVLFGVADYVPSLMQYVKKYQANLAFNTTLIAVDGPKKLATFNVKAADGTVSQVVKPFDMLHVVPPQKPPTCIKNSVFANADGWVEVDQTTLQHVKYPNVFSLGDVCASPNAKTVAAARKQVVVVAENLLALRANHAMPTLYDGYGSCPLMVEKGKVILAEFGFGGKLLPTFPLNSLVPRRINWVLKKYILPIVYWHGMLKGREWLARPAKPDV